MSNRIDPLGLCSRDEDFQLLAVNPECTVIGYASMLTTGQSAMRLIAHLEQRGWRADTSSGENDWSLSPSDASHTTNAGLLDLNNPAVRIEDLTGSFALVLSNHAAGSKASEQMMVQLFPISSGCSIVVELF